MDGSLAGQLLQGRRIEPVTTYFAVTQLPEWVYGMVGGQVRYETLTNSLGHDIYILIRGIAGPDNRLWLLPQDFQICLNIAQSTIAITSPQGKQAALTYIQQQLQVQFAGRGIPPRRC